MRIRPSTSRRKSLKTAVLNRMEILEPRQMLATAVWDGGGADNKWLTAQNWVGDVAPSPGDALWFVGGAARKTNANNFPAATNFASINFAAGGYILSGARIQLSGDIVGLQSSGNNTLNMPFTTSGARRIVNNYSATLLEFGGAFALGGTLTVAGSGNTTLKGVISGAAGIVKNGPGTLTQEGDNTYSGTTIINAGVLAVSGFGNPLGNEATGTVVNSGATLQTQHINDNMGEPLTLHGFGVRGDTLGSTRGALEIGPPAFTTWTGPISLGSDASIGVNHTGDFTVTTNPIRLNGRQLTINGAGPTKLNSPIVDGVGGSGSLIINSAFVRGTEYGTVTSTVANTYTGVTQIYSGVLSLSQNGSLASTDIRVNAAPGLGTSNGFPSPGGVLKLDNLQVLQTNRISDAANITLAGGALDFVGFNGASASTETIGSLRLTAGHSYVRSEAAAHASASNRLTFGNIVRSPGATLDFRGSDLGTSKNRLLFTTAPTKVGANGGILPYATYTSTQHDFATYSVTQGISPFTGYATNLATATANDIVLLTSSQTLAANASVTGLLIRDAGANTTLTLSGATLNVSQALATTSTATTSNKVSLVPSGTASQLTFGAEGIVHRNTPTTISTAITGESALTFSGVGALVLEPPVEGNSFTGGATLNSGPLTINNKNTPLGAANGPLQLRGGVFGASVFVGTYSIPNPLLLSDANANFAAISKLSFTGPITVTGRNVMAVPQNVTLDFVGKVSGTGKMIVTAAMNSGSGGGTLSLSNATNDYSGGTTLANSGIFSPTLNLNASNVLGSGPFFLSGGNITAGSVFSIAKPISLASSSVTFGGTNVLQFTGAVSLIGVNTLSRNSLGGPNVTFSGVLSGSGAITKSGNNMLRLVGNNTYSGSTLATEGTLAIYGNQPSSPVGVVKNGTVASVLTGNGTLGFLSVSKQGVVAPGAGSAFAQLNASGANFSDLGTLKLRVGNDAPSGTDFDSLFLGTGRLIVGPQSTLQIDLASMTTPRTVSGLVKFGTRLGVSDQFRTPALLNNPNSFTAAATYTTTDLNVDFASPSSFALALPADEFFRALGDGDELL
jgi:fibronectin-binding autotransporter adhesin